MKLLRFSACPSTLTDTRKAVKAEETRSNASLFFFSLAARLYLSRTNGHLQSPRILLALIERYELSKKHLDAVGAGPAGGTRYPPAFAGLCLRPCPDAGAISNRKSGIRIQCKCPRIRHIP